MRRLIVLLLLLAFCALARPEPAEAILYTTATCPTTGAKLGDECQKKGDGKKYYFNGSAWIETIANQQTPRPKTYTEATLPANCTSVLGDGAIVGVTDGLRGIRKCKNNHWLMVNELDVSEWGAPGDDPTVDETAEIQAAVDFLTTYSATGKRPTLTFSGQHRITSPISFIRGITVEPRGAGATILCDVSNDFAFKVGLTSAGGGSENHQMVIRGLTFKWYGTFDTSTCGGVSLGGTGSGYGTGTSGSTIASVVEDNLFWGLGKEAIYADFNVNLTVRNNVVREHLGSDMFTFTSEGSPADNHLYGLIVENNFLAYTAGHLNAHYNIRLDSAFNAVVRNNAFEYGLGCIRTATRQTTIENNFFEGCTTSVDVRHVGETLAIRGGNVFVGNTGPTGTGITFNSIDPEFNLARSVEITGNFFATLDTGIHFGSRIFGNLKVEGNEYDQQALVTTKVSGYPGVLNQNTQLDVTALELDSGGNAALWTKTYDPTGTGAMAQATTGYYAPFSLEMTMTGPAGAYPANANKTVFTRTLPAALDLSGYDYFLVPVWVDDASEVPQLRDTLMNGFNIISFETVTDTDSYNIGWIHLYAGATGICYESQRWCLVVLPKALFTASGTPNWNSIVSIKLTVSAKGGSAIPTQRVGGIYAMKLNGINRVANSGIRRGFTKFIGPTGSEKTFTLPDVDATLTYAGGPATIGSGGTTITKHLSATASLNFDLSGAGITCQDLTITVTGAAAGNTVSLGVPDALASTAGVEITGWVSAADTVTVRACDVTSGNPDPAAATIRADVWQH